MKQKKLTIAISQIIGIGLLGLNNLNAADNIAESTTYGLLTYRDANCSKITVNQSSKLNDDFACVMGALEKGGESNIMVDTVAFNTVTDGFCSLFEAVTNANLDNNKFTDCSPGQGTDRIGFTPNLNGLTITATNVLSLDSEITFDGPGADQLTLSGGNSTQIFNLSSSATITIDGLALVNGYSINSDGGGAIYNDGGQLTINNSILNNNTASFGGGAINSRGSTILNQVSMDNNQAKYRGGAIYHSSSATLLQINRSSFTNNFTTQSKSEGGGAINIRGPSATIRQSTFKGNSASLNGGAIHQRYWPITVINSTFTDNSAGSNGGGIFASNKGSISNVRNSTFTGNSAAGDGASINTIGTLKISNSILAGNESTNECLASIIGNNNNNLVEDGSCFFNATNQLTGDPMLLAVADNGGFTLTHLPLFGSPVIDAGSNISCEMIDQRNLSRPQDGNIDGFKVCDIGAVEVADPDIIFINSFES